MHFFSYKKKEKKQKQPVPILSAIIPVCVFSNVPLMKEEGQCDINLFKAKKKKENQQTNAYMSYSVHIHLR